MAIATGSRSTGTTLDVALDEGSAAAGDRYGRPIVDLSDMTELSYEMWPDRPSRAEFLGTRTVRSGGRE